MKPIAHVLWDALTGSMLAAAIVRIAIATNSAAVPDLATGQTEQAGFLPQFLDGFFVTPEQLTLMNVMAATVLFVGAAWALAQGAAIRTRASG